MFKRAKKKKGFLSAHHQDRKILGDCRVLGTMRVRRVLSCLFTCCFLLSASVVLADDSLWNKGVVGGTGPQTNMRYPADFNVFSFNNIEGISQWNTFADIDGPMAAGDTLTLRSFRLNYDTSTDHQVAAVAGRIVNFDTGGTIYGNVYYGFKNGYGAPLNQITYVKQSSQSKAEALQGALRQPIDFIQAHDDLTYYSDLLSKLAPTAGWHEAYGAIHFDCSGNKFLEVFEINAEDLDSPVEIWLDNLRANPIILINVKGDHSVNINYTSIRSTNGDPNSSRILWNFPVVKEINIAGIAFKGSLLAPWADVEVKWGSFAGTLVANNVSGSAELYHWPFQGYGALQDKIENDIFLDPIQVVGIHLASEYKSDAPTTVGIVTWSVDEAEMGNVESAEIRFWKNAPGAPVMVAPVDTTESNSYYRTLLLGMKPGTTYNFQINVTTNAGNYNSIQYEITTGPLPASLLTINKTEYDRSKRAPGFLISESFNDDLAFILDMDGDIVWWHKYVCTTGTVDDMCRAIMSADGKYMWMTFDTGKKEFCFLHKARMDTLVTETFDAGASHDVAAVENDTIAYLNWNEGANWDWYPSVYEMYTHDDGTTTQLEIFETADVDGYVPWPYPPLDIDPVPKLNALRYYKDEVLDEFYPKGLYSVSDKNFDIIVFDPSVPDPDPDAKIVLRMSEVEGIDYNPKDDWNHGHQLLYDSTGITGIIFFNTNIGNNSVVEYALEYSGGVWTGSKVHEYVTTTSMFTLAFGDVQRLPNGNTMVTCSYKGIIVELDSDWNELMRLNIQGVTGNWLGYSCWRPALYGPIDDGITENPVTVTGKHLASEYNNKAPTTVGIVTWAVDEEVITSIDSAVIRFWKEGGPVREAPVDLTEPEYRTLLLGMKPNSTYFFQVYVTSGGQTYTSDPNTITTGSLPAGMPSLTKTEYYPDKRDRGFIISCIRLDELAFILDADGDIVWWYKCEDSTLSDMNRAIMSYDGKYMWMDFAASKQSPGSLLRVSMDTLQTKTFKVGASHDVTAVDKDTIAYICWNEAAPDIGGTADAYPSVYEMDTNDAGTITNLKEIFETATVSGYVPWPYNGGDVTQLEDPHLNALHYYPEVGPAGLYPGGLYSVSDRAMDIFVIDRNGNIIIRLSQVQSIDASNPMDYNPLALNETNHGHQLLYDSTGITGIVIFNNGGNITHSSTKSYVCEYKLEYSGGVWRGEPVHPRWEFQVSSVLGDAQRLSNGNTLVTVSVKSDIIEMMPDELGNGVKVMQLRFNKSIGYSCWRTALYGPPPYQQTTP